MKRWVQMHDEADNDLTVFKQNKLPGIIKQKERVSHLNTKFKQSF